MQANENKRFSLAAVLFNVGLNRHNEYCAARSARVLRVSMQKPCTSGNQKLLKTPECSCIHGFSVVFDLFRTHYLGLNIKE